MVASDPNFNSPIAGYNPKVINAPLLTDNITNLSPSTTYHLKLRAKNGTNSYSAYTFPISATTPVAALPPPTFPTASATAITSSSFQINWNGVSGAASYQVDVSADPNFTSFVINNQAVTITSAPVNSLSGGTTYYYRIRAVNGVGVASANSVTSQVVTAPVAPTGFAVSSVTSSSMSVNWVAVSAAIQYELFVATDQGFNFPIAGYNPKTVIAPALADDITGLSATTTYYLKLRAKGETGLFSDFTFTSAATTAVGGSTGIKLSNVVFDPVHITGAAQELAVDISGSTGSVSVTLYHRKNSEDVFSQEPVQLQNEKYKIAVSDTWFDSFGMEFYFKAQDQSSQASSTVSKITAGVSNVAISLNSFGPDQKNYQVISFPYNFQDRSLVQDVFEQVMGSYNKKKWRLFQYRDGVNVEYTEGISASTIEQGKAYWFVSKNEVGLTLGQGKSFGNSLTSSFKLQLKKGWNQIGNPFPYNLGWEEVLSTNNNPAGVSNLIVFDNTSVSFIESDLLAVFGGGFVFADEPIELVFPVTLKAKANGRVASKSFLPELKHPRDWYLPIGLKQGEVTSTMGGIGMLKDAREGKDCYDRNSPPNFIRFVEFNSGVKDYPAELTRNISSHQNQKVWNYEVNSNSNEPVELQWNNELVKSLEAQLILFDETTQHVVNMADVDSHLTVSTSKISIHFTHEPLSLEVKSIAIGEAYPNPFVHDVTIPFDFSIGEPSEATLKIIDLNGSILMKTEALKTEDGIKSVQWNGQSDEGIEVKSGMYIYQVFGSRPDGKSFRFTGKLIKQ
jgi:chitodextrinase